MNELENKIIIVEKKKKEQQKKIGPKEIYEKLKNEFSDFRRENDLNLNYKGRKHYIFPLLEKKSLTTWKKIVDEIEKIDNRNSNLSSNNRAALVQLYTHCFLEAEKLKEENENSKNNK